MPEKPYANPELLVDTAWVAFHIDDPSIRLVESDEDYLLYETGHIPGAVKVDWFTSLQDPLRRDLLSPAAFAAMCSRLGIAAKTIVVFYGDRNNWFACYAFWLFTYYSHSQCRLMNGGRFKWEREHRPLTRTVPSYNPTFYQAAPPDPSIRALRDQVLAHQAAGGPLIDVRTPQEFSGELHHMPDYPQEGAARAGHIPGAANIPWTRAVDENDGTFKPVEALRAAYVINGFTPDREIITYCRIGERAAHTWFVLKVLLGYPRVRNYDGSWVEWGNLVNAPIARGEA